MYCSHCGKEISAQAVMCPFCGEPTKNASAKMTEPEATTPVKGDNVTGLSAVSLILSAFAFVTGIIFGAFFYCFTSSVVLLYIIGATTILPGLAGLSLGAYVTSLGVKNSTARTCATTAIVLSVIVLLFLFITASILGAS